MLCILLIWVWEQIPLRRLRVAMGEMARKIVVLGIIGAPLHTITGRDPQNFKLSRKIIPPSDQNRLHGIFSDRWKWLCQSWVKTSNYERSFDLIKNQYESWDNRYSTSICPNLPFFWQPTYKSQKLSVETSLIHLHFFGINAHFNKWSSNIYLPATQQVCFLHHRTLTEEKFNVNFLIREVWGLLKRVHAIIMDFKTKGVQIIFFLKDDFTWCG